MLHRRILHPLVFNCFQTIRLKYKLTLSITLCSVHLPVFFTTTSGPLLKQKDGLPVDCKWMSDFGPSFHISGDDVEVLRQPSEFYDRLKELASKAKERVTIASLYIGTGTREEKLVSSLRTALANADCEVQVLLDVTRGSRGIKNSRTLLLPLIQDFPGRMQVSLYHAPALRGWIKKLLPERWNEIISLTHLKIYLFDNTLVLSGANLSDNYFTMRQDRYVVFNNCEALADYFHSLVQTVSSFSLQLMPDDNLSLHPNWTVHPEKGDPRKFSEEAYQRLSKFLCSKSFNLVTITSSLLATNSGSDTVVYPLLQMYPLGVSQDEHVTEHLLVTVPSGSIIKLASGYFNLTEKYEEIILQSSPAEFDLLVASPKVNGFYGAKGISGAIPDAYTHIAKKFYERVCDEHQERRIRLHEYDQENWTFHVKGLWVYYPGETLPSVTLIGSPNFGYRSVYRDLEAQVAIITSNENLRKQLHEEQQNLYERTSLVDQQTFKKPDRQIPLWVKFVTKFIKTYF
ncbi:CDP-diacylglycerol--glycerol-3-phosphate 3-phosphatidyltransferase, mitochondrial-like isoform X2 [Limulus polyphemus]|uniref:CDP-diacylglycerol--glycerol-3-phosphate 3-phosphatidyltransferase n=1 Tax=Limulus polyphemus TaxID=6850 RepID=A0ABM1TL98_LIMPO|nr:CDP-diacylglycerol--glycerol-3-phosphate 3-phosphatidyltransferase, mitochondrial-like isoform X2 [Limulus polyphemus]